MVYIFSWVYFNIDLKNESTKFRKIMFYSKKVRMTFNNLLKITKIGNCKLLTFF